MSRQEVLACDLDCPAISRPGQDDDDNGPNVVRTYDVSIDGKRRLIDLCGTHARGLREFVTILENNGRTPEEAADVSKGVEAPTEAADMTIERETVEPPARDVPADEPEAAKTEPPTFTPPTAVNNNVGGRANGAVGSETRGRKLMCGDCSQVIAMAAKWDHARKKHGKKAGQVAWKEVVNTAAAS